MRNLLGTFMGREKQAETSRVCVFVLGRGSKHRKLWTLCKSEGRHCTELHPSIFIFFDRGYKVGSLRSAISLLAADVYTTGGQGGGPRRAVRPPIDT